MAVPDFQSFMRPLLEQISDGQRHNISDLYGKLAAHFSLSQDDLEELLPSGKQAKYHNRILWAKFHLSKAEAVSTLSRGVIVITDVGRQLIIENQGEITMRNLLSIPAYLRFAQHNKISNSRDTVVSPTEISLVPPAEQMDALYIELNVNLADELISQVQRLTPAQFERLVVQLLVAMGYGGNVRDAGAALGKSGDNGIDGMIKQDPLGLDRVYVQAKRWSNSVHSPEIRTFAGSLTFHRASKGVFITTSNFSEGAKSTAAQIGNIILIGGEQLAGLMIEYSVGVLTRSTYLIRRVDGEFFEEL